MWNFKTIILFGGSKLLEKNHFVWKTYFHFEFLSLKYTNHIFTPVVWIIHEVSDDQTVEKTCFKTLLFFPLLTETSHYSTMSTSVKILFLVCTMILTTDDTIH